MTKHVTAFNFSRKYLRSSFLILLGLTYISMSSGAFALSTTDLESIYNNTVMYDTTVSTTTSSCTAPAASVTSPRESTTITSGQKVYILGDSITVRAAASYQSALRSHSIDTTVDGSVSRSITGAGIDGNKLSGLAAVDADADAIKSADVVVVGLGTNGNNSAQNVDNLVASIRKYNTKAPLFWIDTTVINRPDYETNIIKTSNTAIYGEAKAQNYTVISWFKMVTPNGDPINPTGTETDDNKYIEIDNSVNAHPTYSVGVPALASLVVQVLLTGAPPNGRPVTANGCTSSTLSGDGNEAQVYNFLIGQGLTPTQAAGLMGNLKAEAHFEPKLVQYGHTNCRGEKSVAGQPSSMCDTLVVDGNTGYGIAQWTSAGRQQNLLDFAASKSTIAGDLGVQLGFLWQELSTGLNKNVLTPLKATSDLREATDIVLRHFECPRACADLATNPSPENRAAYAAVLDTRFGFAQAILTQFGSA